MQLDQVESGALYFFRIVYMPETKQIIYQIGKTQMIRVFDFAVLGPGLILYGTCKKKLTVIERILFIGIGITTAGYNLHNYVKQQKILESSPQSEQ